MSAVLQNREIVIGVTGGIAAYKTAMLVSRLVQSGAGVLVVMTKGATQLVAPKTFEALTRRPVAMGMWDTGIHPHLELAQEADLLCVAPATANFLAKAALGLADDLLSTLWLAFTGPQVVAPAMNTAMWEKPAVKRNLDVLRQDGVHIIEPETGYLSCGTVGAGRMAEPEKILQVITEILSKLPPRKKQAS
jgi:phosphopantothenoylcysteine decarboxylase/phosphopantothenate--cysteine ligase